jgi:UPF0755 protein
LKLLRRIRRAVLVGTALVALASGLWLDRAITTGARGEGDVRIEIPKGTKAPGIIQRLHVAGLAPHPRIAYWVLRYHETFQAVQAGVHLLPQSASLVQIASLLIEPPAHPEVTLTLIPGETVWHAAKRIEAAGLGSHEALLALAADRTWVRDLGLPVGPERPTRADGVTHTYLEGFLTPETHFFDPDSPLEAVVKTLTSDFMRMWTPLITRRESDLTLLKEQLGLNPIDVLTLASLVQRETKVSSEAPIIAGVFMNRLRVKMRLQTDPTLIYHPDRIEKVPGPSDRKDSTNPYNTYAYDGLPPGPICSPTRTAVEATLSPSRHDFLYFCARHDGTGRHAFARTLTEHEANVTRFLKRR